MGRKKIEGINFRITSISVRVPEFDDSIAALSENPDIIDGVNKMGIGYGVNRSTIIAYLIRKAFTEAQAKQIKAAA